MSRTLEQEQAYQMQIREDRRDMRIDNEDYADSQRKWYEAKVVNGTVSAEMRQGTVVGITRIDDGERYIVATPQWRTTKPVILTALQAKSMLRTARQGTALIEMACASDLNLACHYHDII